MHQGPHLDGSVHPITCIIYFLFACLPCAYLIANSGKSSVVRILWLPNLLFVAHRLLRSVSHATTSTVVNDVFAGESAIVLLQCFNLLLVSRLDDADLQNAGVYQEPAGSITRTIRTLGLLLNLRGISTPWQVKTIHSFPKWLYTSDQNGHDERKTDTAEGKINGKANAQRYILRQATIIAWQYLLLDIIHTSELEADPEMNHKLFGISSEYTYLSATPEQWAGRVSAGLLAWFGPARVNIDFYYRILSLFCVMLGFGDPEDWPPLFGSMLDVYSLRRFGGRFWHQFCRWPLTSVSNYIARDLLRLPRPSVLERYTNIFLVFLTSGAVHAILDAYAHVPLSEMRAIAFAACFALGIMIEDGVQALWRRYVYTSSASAASKNADYATPLWHKIAGFIWVAAWMILTSPWFIYPQARLPAEMKWQVPFSIAQRVGSPVAHGFLVGGGVAIKVLFG